MQNLRNLFILTIAVICANDGSTFAQDEHKAFKEGDKILSIGIGPGNESVYPIYTGFGYGGFFLSATNRRIAPSISFDYGLKGTRGIVSIGGFMSYSQNNLGSDVGSYIYRLERQDSLYLVSTGFKYSTHTLTAGLRVGLHYATRKWDLYAGTMIGYQRIIRESTSGTRELYKGVFSGVYPPNNGILQTTEHVDAQSFSSGKIIFSPYIGARYYITKKLALNIEAGQHTGNVGLSFKF